MLLILLAVPLVIGLVAFLFTKGTITMREFIVQEIVMVVLILTGFGIGIYKDTHDVEIWNGTIARKWSDTQSCCHSYPCRPHSCFCDDDGCSTCYDTCYMHSEDIYWKATTSNDETAYYDGCNAPSTDTPARFEEIVVGEPTAIEHPYTNWLKANPDTVLKRTGALEKFKDKVPPYPETYDWYRAKRFLLVGVSDARQDEWDDMLDRLNADLGQSKQVNITVIVTDETDPTYAEAVRESWLGGKKNDFIVVIGATHYPEIDWVGVISWSNSEDAKIEVRNGILALSVFDGPTVLEIIGTQVESKYVRREMKDFEYLKRGLSPSGAMVTILFIVGVLFSLTLSIVFHYTDPLSE